MPTLPASRAIRLRGDRLVAWPTGLAGFGGRDCSPGVPGDLEDHDGDDEADDRVAAVEAKRDGDRAADHPERDKAVDAGVVTVSD